MGKGSSAAGKQEVADYRMSLHYGICTGPVILREIQIMDRVVWEGSKSTPGPIYINQPSLFGGPAKEGGVQGTIYFLPGKPDQIMPDALARRLDPSLTNATCPAFRGVATCFFIGDLENGGGFLWGSNNPTIPGVKFKVERAPVGLDGRYAMMTDGVSITFNGYTVMSRVETYTLTNGVAAVVDSHTLSRSVSQVDGTATYVIDGLNLVIQPYVTGSNNAQYPGNTVTLGSDTRTTGASGAIDFGSAVVSVNNGIVTYSVSGDQNPNANPAHMIFECLTNNEWGMAAPSYLINQTGFELVAKKLYDEQFPLSVLWTQQDTIEKYISEIIDHILATIFVNPRTGLLDIMLLRDDYDYNSLPQINPGNAKMRSFKRKLYGETINEVIVTWTNPANEQQETVGCQDDANIEIQGAPVSDNRNYYMVRSAALAARIAARDSRSASAPLATMEIEVDRSGWDLLPGSVCRVNWPRYKLNDVVCRVVKVAYGKAGDPSVKVTLLEDIFSLSHLPPSLPPSTGSNGTGQVPTAMAFSKLLTLPHFLVAKETASTLEYPAVMAGLLAYQPGGETTSYDLYTERPLANGAMQWQSVGTKSIVGRSTLLTPIYAEATSTITGLPLTGEARGPVASGLAFFGDGGEDTMEIALLQSLDGTTWTVRRGVLDTTPRYWPIGTPVWFLAPNATIGDTLELRSVAETPAYRALSRTSRGVLDLADAPDVSAMMTARPHAPLRPANVKINGQGFGDIDASGLDHLTITWATRNRLTEDVQLVPWDSPSVTPEYLQMSIVTIFRENGQEMIHWRGMYSETSLNVPISYLQQEKRVFVRVSAERSGVSSLQSHGLWVNNIPQVANPAPPPASSEGSAPPAPPTASPDPSPDPVAGVGDTQYTPPAGDNPGSWEIP